MFRSGPGKSRLAFLSRLSGSASLHVINHAALEYMEERAPPRIVIDKFRVFKDRIFASRQEWEACLNALALGEVKVTPDPILIATEAGLWGAIRHQGFLSNTVIVSEAGQFSVDLQALCWVHAERLIHKLVPANDKQRNAIGIAKRMIWRLHGGLKEYKLVPNIDQAEILRSRFDRIFKRARTGYATLDSLLR